MKSKKTVPAIADAARESLAGALNLPDNKRAEFMRGFDIGTKGATFNPSKLTSTLA
jgi:hypothetical protein